MATITLTIPDELARKLRALDAASLADVLQKGLAQREAARTLDERLRYMQTDDVIAASHRAKEHSDTSI